MCFNIIYNHCQSYAIQIEYTINVLLVFTI